MRGGTMLLAAALLGAGAWAIARRDDEPAEDEVSVPARIEEPWVALAEAVGEHCPGAIPAAEIERLLSKAATSPDAALAEWRELVRTVCPAAYSAAGGVP